MATSFVKLQGTGNDFILFDLRFETEEQDWQALAPGLCDRHFGIGADGLLLVLPSTAPGAAFRMRVINSDGSEPEMCGNGLRCFVRYLHDQGLVEGATVAVETGAGVLRAEILGDAGSDGTSAFQVRLDMGRPFVMGREMLPMGDRRLDVHLVSMGNPHCVTFVDDLDRVPFAEVGPAVEGHPRFRQRTNAEFVQVLNRGRLRVKVWERGAGPTLACGTGACAAVVAAISRSLTDRHVIVELPGGALTIDWQVGGSVFLTGPAEPVFTGQITLSALAPTGA
ncbi:Diaminopimelate epimerase [compost metagenome]